MKKCVLLILTLLIVSSLVLCVSAAQPFVVDEGDLLTQQEQADLSEYLQQISNRHDADIVVVTVDSLNGQSSGSYADNYYDDNRYADDGILLLVSIGDRQWYISTCGRCNDLIDHWGTDSLSEHFLPDLSRGDYFDAFYAFADACDDMLAQGNGSVETDSGLTGKTVLICLGIGAVIGLITVFVLRSQLKSVRAQGYAGSYVQHGSLELTGVQDIYLYRNVVRTEKPKSNSSGSGGGRSHSGGGGSF